jgi:hypothetical protein
MHMNTKLAIICLLLASGIFVLDIVSPLHGVVSVLYVILVLMSLISAEAIFTIWTTIISSVLIGIGIWHGEEADLINRVFALIIILLAAILSVQRKEVEKELRELNLNLELKVLARTAASENKSLRLEKQIKILEGLREVEKDQAFQMLDTVIKDLRDIRYLDYELEPGEIDVEFK